MYVAIYIIYIGSNIYTDTYISYAMVIVLEKHFVQHSSICKERGPVMTHDDQFISRALKFKSLTLGYSFIKDLIIFIF